MIASIGRLILVVLLTGAPAPSLAEEAGSAVAGLASRVFQYLDAVESDAAERLLQGVLSDERASIDTVSQLIRTSRIYQNQPVGNLPHEQIMIRGQTYPLSLFIPSTYQPSQSYSLVVCLHGFGFTAEEYLERWQGRLSEDYLLACPTYPSGAWFTRRAEELVLATIRELRTRYHIGGVIEATLGFLVLKLARAGKDEITTSEFLRQKLGAHLLLGLEIFIAADIISSVVSPSWSKVGILSAIVAIRTVLSYFLRMEVRQARE